MIKVTLKDSSIKEFEGKVSVLDIAKSISEGLARAVVALQLTVKQQVLTMKYVKIAN